MTGWSSQVPAAITALLAAFRAAPALTGPDTDIRDGPVVTGSAALEAVLVGWSGQNADLMAADATVNPEVFGDADDRERFSVRCAVMVMNGQGDMGAARVRAYALLAACGAVVRGDRTIGGTVGDSHIGTHMLRQEPRPDGAVATVVFTVVCDTYTGP